MKWIKTLCNILWRVVGDSSIKYVRKMFRKTNTSYPLIRTMDDPWHEIG